MSYKPDDMATCRMCGATIRYTGSEWEHLGGLQPRHPALPKEKDFEPEITKLLGRYGVTLGDEDEPVPDDLIEIVRQKAPEEWTKLERLTAATYYQIVKPDLERLYALVQNNQDFFGDPVAGESCLKLAADKLEQVIGVWRVGGQPMEPEEETVSSFEFEPGVMDNGTEE
jgi:hypothetical protein